MRWLKDVDDDIYDPTYTDMLRVACTSAFLPVAPDCLYTSDPLLPDATA